MQVPKVNKTQLNSILNRKNDSLKFHLVIFDGNKLKHLLFDSLLETNEYVKNNKVINFYIIYGTMIRKSL